MSTKATIQYFDDESGGGYHLYADCLDTLSMKDEECPIYLELNGVEFNATSPGTVTVRIPHAWAVKLGLISDTST
ncbi:hypothetical protein ACQE3D_06000 [Methylomonas sp. MS20]|uniref:hypothetical protein n=1 Tax=unclassified Methylomonas TaxID=2608980 RepID=UPI0028A52A32|nr:hypothetical protein [Methylomonas sp. MV1]MDT4329501.1 hypothetical protein [Methylomonas sp. MV1]